jgi:hypothetical protein
LMKRRIRKLWGDVGTRREIKSSNEDTAAKFFIGVM